MAGNGRSASQQSRTRLSRRRWWRSSRRSTRRSSWGSAMGSDPGAASTMRWTRSRMGSGHARSTGFCPESEIRLRNRGMYGQSLRAISRDCLKDGIGSLGPDEWLGMVIVGLNKGRDIGLELIDAAMDAALDLLIGEQREPAFDLVEPGGAGRREVEVIARVAGEPRFDGWRFVGGVVVEHQMDVEIGWHGLLDLRQEFAEFDRPVVLVAAADDPTGGDVQGGEQRGCAVALVVMTAPRDLPRPQRQQRLSAVERLDLRLFVDTQHQGAVGWVEIKPNDVAHLVNKQRGGRQFEGFEAVRLQSEGPPDATHARGRDAAVPRHTAGAPVGGSGRPALQRLHDDMFDLGIVDCARPLVAVRRAARRGRARQSADATCRRFAPSPARAPQPTCCSGPRRNPTRCAPAMPRPAPSCAAAYSFPVSPRLHSTVRSSLPGDPFASPTPDAAPSPN